MVRESSSHRRQRCRCLLLSLTVILILGAVVVLAAVIFAKKKDPPAELSQWKGSGSTGNLKEIMLGRCFIYTRIVNPELRNDCVKIWEAFKNAFISKNPCDITEQDYRPLMELAAHPILCNKTLLWSKTSELAHKYTKVQGNLLTLEDTLLGYMADGLTWCGSPSNSEMNYESCPHWRECANNPSSIFWKLASKTFAESACGVVHVMLNGSISHAFVNSSDSCSSSSIKELKSIIEGRNIAFSCKDDHRDVQLIQCVGNSEEPVCRANRTES